MVTLNNSTLPRAEALPAVTYGEGATARRAAARPNVSAARVGGGGGGQVGGHCREAVGHEATCHLGAALVGIGTRHYW